MCSVSYYSLLFCLFFSLNSLSISELQTIEIGAILSSVTTEESLDSAARIVIAFTEDEQFLSEYTELCIHKIKLLAKTLKKSLSVTEREQVMVLVEDIVAWQTEYITICSDQEYCCSQDGQKLLQEHQAKLYTFLSRPLVASLLYYGLLAYAELQEGAGPECAQRLNDILACGVHHFKDELL